MLGLIRAVGTALNENLKGLLINRKLSFGENSYVPKWEVLFIKRSFEYFLFFCRLP